MNKQCSHLPHFDDSFKSETVCKKCGNRIHGLEKDKKYKLLKIAIVFLNPVTYLLGYLFSIVPVLGFSFAVATVCVMLSFERAFPYFYWRFSKYEAIETQVPFEKPAQLSACKHKPGFLNLSCSQMTCKKCGKPIRFKSDFVIMLRNDFSLLTLSLLALIYYFLFPSIAIAKEHTKEMEIFLLVICATAIVCMALAVVFSKLGKWNTLGKAEFWYTDIVLVLSMLILSLMRGYLGADTANRLLICTALVLAVRVAAVLVLYIFQRYEIKTGEAN